MLGWTYTPNDTESHPACCNCSNTTGCSLKSHTISSQQWRHVCSNCDAVQLGGLVLMLQWNLLLSVWGQQVPLPVHSATSHNTQYPLLENLKSQTLHWKTAVHMKNHSTAYCQHSPQQHAATKTKSDLYVWTKINQNYH